MTLTEEQRERISKAKVELNTLLALADLSSKHDTSLEAERLLNRSIVAWAQLGVEIMAPLGYTKDGSKYLSSTHLMSFLHDLIARGTQS